MGEFQYYHPRLGGPSCGGDDPDEAPGLQEYYLESRRSHPRRLRCVRGTHSQDRECGEQIAKPIDRNALENRQFEVLNLVFRRCE